jgi:YidC/Oxa1 family membrane protein insertase
MQELQPEINKLQKQYKNEPDRLNQETMALWKKYGVNPFSSCLLLLVQFPFIIAFFRVLQAYEPLKTATFFWLDLGKADPFYILPVLAAVTTYFQVKFSSPPGGGGQTQMMLIAFPLLIGYMALNFAAALSLYWVVSNLCSVGERFLVPKTSVPKGESTGR